MRVQIEKRQSESKLRAGHQLQGEGGGTKREGGMEVLPLQKKGAWRKKVLAILLLNGGKKVSR